MEAGMTCKEIKRETTCGLSFDFRSCQASKRNDVQTECRDKTATFCHDRGAAVMP